MVDICACGSGWAVLWVGSYGELAVNLSVRDVLGLSFVFLNVGGADLLRLDVECCLVSIMVVSGV